MSAHDDYLDVRSAFEAYEKAYVAWGRAVDGKPPGWEPASEAVCKRAATILVKRARDLQEAAIGVEQGMRARGWPVLPEDEDPEPIGQGDRSCPCGARVPLDRRQCPRCGKRGFETES